MKKLLALVLAVLVLIPSAWAEVDLSSLDYSTFSEASDEDLQRILDLARNELFLRRENAHNEYQYLVDMDDVKIYLTGEYSVYSGRLFLEYVFINDTDFTVSIYTDDCYVNGWKAYSGLISETQPHKKSKGKLDVKISDADIYDYSALEEIEWHFHARAKEKYSAKIELDPVTIYFK